MIENVLLLLVFVGLIFLVVSQPRWQSRRYLLRLVYRNVDETLGVRKFINDLRATKNRWLYLGLRTITFGAMKRHTAQGIANVFFPHTQLGGIMALPTLRTRKKFVYVGFERKPWPLPYLKRDILLVRVTWTSEARVYRIRQPSFMQELEWDLCRALSLVWHEGIFAVLDHRKPDPGRPSEQARDQFTFTFAEPLRVPGDLRGETELNNHEMDHIGDRDTEELDA